LAYWPPDIECEIDLAQTLELLGRHVGRMPSKATVIDRSNSACASGCSAAITSPHGR
jgi:hypothetical protein